MKVLFINDSEKDIPSADLETWVRQVAGELKKRQILPAHKAQKELSLVFLKANDAKQINWTYRQKDYPTDVLSFETEDPESIGELVLCTEVLEKQAKEHKLSLLDETAYMVLHGLLHLLGFDHEKNEDEAKKMMGLQDEIFELLRQPKKKEKAKAAPVKVKAAVKAKTKAPVKAAKRSKAVAKSVKAAKKPAKPAAASKSKSAGKTKSRK